MTSRKYSTEIRLLPISRLSVDHDYQRDLDESWMRELYGDFKEHLIGTLVVSVREDGREVVLDGQHRLAMLRHLAEDNPGEGPRSVYCECYFGLSPQDEADIFIGRNNQKTVHPIHKHKAAVAAGVPKAVAINEIVRRHGVDIAFSRKRGYASVEVLYKAYEWGCLDDIIRIIEESWAVEGDVAAGAARTNIIINGVMLFHVSAIGVPGYSVDEAIRKFRSRTRILGLSRNARDAAYATRTSIAYQVAEILRTQAYNYQRTSSRVPEIITRFPRKGL